MPGELGNEEEQAGVGYYEHRTPPDDTPNMEPPGSIEDMRKKTRPTSVMKVLRDFTEEQMKNEQGKQELM
jgi:hypothetical protein